MDDLSDFFASVAATVDTTLEEIFATVRPSTSERLNRAIRWSTFAGGKRFRPALIFASGRTFGVDDTTLAKTAAAVEMVHTYSLIHDDLPAMDNDDIRRGRQTCHKKFGEATAILAGDALQALAFEVLTKDDLLPVETRLKLAAELSEAAGKMVIGQQMDLSAEGKVVTPDEVSEIHACKTGALITFCARAGAIIAGLEEHRLTGITHFGARLGLLFQITDDILDVTEPSIVLGKTAAKDVSSNKATYPSVYGLGESRQLLQKVHQNTLDSLDLFDVPPGLLADLANYVATRRS